MKLLFISDVHSNAEALAVLEPELCSADRVVCLGDLIGYFCQVNEVIDRLRELDALCIMGNHDHYVLTQCPEHLPSAVRFGAAYASEVIDPDNREWLAGLPWVWGGVMDGRSMLFSHGSPWNPMGDYLYAESPRLPEMHRFGFDLAAFGQTHRFLYRHDGRPQLLNPGSVGQNREPGQQALASAAMLDTQTMSAEHILRPYDPGPVIEAARAAGAGDWIQKHLQ